jgi:hypothetical protein
MEWDSNAIFFEPFINLSVKHSTSDIAWHPPPNIQASLLTIKKVRQQSVINLSVATLFSTPGVNNAYNTFTAC